MYKCLIVFIVLACLVNCSGKKPSYTTNSDKIKKETVADNSATDNIQQDYSVEEENINWREKTLEYYYEGYIPDGKNLILTNLYSDIRNEIHQEQPNWGTIDNGINELENSLVDFFYTEKNWNVDVGKELPFILVEKASDDRFRFYHWAYESPTGHAYKGILQYRDRSGKIRIVFLDNEFIRDKIRQELGFVWGATYGMGFKIAEDTYLIWANSREGGFMSRASFMAIDISGETIEKGHAIFNGSHRLEFFVGIQYGGKIKDFDTQFEKEPYSIKIETIHEKDAVLELIYNGSEFTGDYNKLYEIIQAGDF